MNYTTSLQTTTMAPNITTTTYCELKEFGHQYKNVHGYLSLFVCIIGSIMNILNIIVLTRKSMRWPTNYILTGLALADLLVMIAYIPFAQTYLDHDSKANIYPYFSYTWAAFVFFYAMFTQACHFISCCLTVILAIWRYIAITQPANNATWCSIHRTKLAIICSYILCPLICTPLFIGIDIKESIRSVYKNGTILYNKDTPYVNETMYNGTLYHIGYTEGFENINFWLYGVVIKLLPCILLTVLSVLLIKALLDTKKRWKTLANSNGIPLVNGDATKTKRNYEKEQQANRTTKMLVAVLLLFLMTEFPQAIMGVLSDILGKEFEEQCYIPLGDLMDIFALTNSAINFILYCSMSQQFRSAFSSIFIPESIKNWHKVDNKFKCKHTEVTTV